MLPASVLLASLSRKVAALVPMVSDDVDGVTLA